MKLFNFYQLFVVLLFWSCTSNTNIPRVYNSENCQQQIKKVDFKKLLDSLAFYNNRYVEVSGIFICGPEESALYDFRMDKNSSIWLEFDPKLSRREKDSTIFLLPSFEEYRKLCNKKIIIKGLVDTSDHGHLGQYKVGLENVCYLQTIK